MVAAVGAHLVAHLGHQFAGREPPPRAPLPAGAEQRGDREQGADDVGEVVVAADGGPLEM